MTLKICKKCGKCVEIIKTISYIVGSEIIEYKCPECGNVDKSITNHVHNGNDKRS